MNSESEQVPFRFWMDFGSGVPAYRQIIDQVLTGISMGRLAHGDQLPTVRQLAVEIMVNPNTVVRAYKELEIRGVVTTHQGTGTFITRPLVKPDEAQRQQRLTRLVAEFVTRTGGEGFNAEEVLERLSEYIAEKRGENLR